MYGTVSVVGRRGHWTLLAIPPNHVRLGVLLAMAAIWESMLASSRRASSISAVRGKGHPASIAGFLALGSKATPPQFEGPSFPADREDLGPGTSQNASVGLRWSVDLSSASGSTDVSRS